MRETGTLGYFEIEHLAYIESNGREKHQSLCSCGRGAAKNPAKLSQNCGQPLGW